MTIDQIGHILSYHLRTELAVGTLPYARQRLAAILADRYEQISSQAKQSTYLHSDETCFRTDGQTHALWCFANAQLCYRTLSPR